MNDLLIIGAGGHGKVVADTAIETGKWNDIAFLDDRWNSLKSVLSLPVMGPLNIITEMKSRFSEIAVAVGDSLLRIELLKKYELLGFSLARIIHPTAFISRHAVIYPGCVVFAQGVVNAGAVIGFGSIINTGSVVEHDCILGEGVHICPGVKLAGQVSIGKHSWIGIGSSVIQQVSIGENVMVGAGTVVIDNVSDNVTVAGVPGRVIKQNG